MRNRAHRFAALHMSAPGTECDIARLGINFRFRGKSGRAADITGMTEFDRECVKTH